MSSSSDTSGSNVENEEGVQNSENWSEHAKKYSKLAEKVPIVGYFNETIAEAFLNICGDEYIKPNSKLLDVCSGPGTFPVSLTQIIGPERIKELSLVVSDFAPGMVDAAREALTCLLPDHPQLEFRVIDVQNIDSPSCQFDVVSCIFGYFVPKRLDAFAEVCRVCREGGVAVIGTWKYAGYAYMWNDFIQYLGKKEPLSAMALAHSCADPHILEAELIGCGFSKVTIEEHSKVFPVPQTEDIVISLLNNPMVKNEIASYDQEFIKSKWIEFIEDESFAYPKRKEGDIWIIDVVYTANIVIAVK